MNATSTVTRGVFERHVAERLEEDSEEINFSGWWCVATSDFPCPANGCSFVARHMTAAHRIIVWAERDDRTLLHHAGLAQRVGRNPRVVEYEQSMGACISYDQFEAIGRPIHGKIDTPEGFPA
jgi:hypothetical protein